MDVRFSTDPESFRRMTAAELRKRFLVGGLFTPGKLSMLYAESERAIIGAAVPVRKALELGANRKEMAAGYFTERREIGVINIGGEGVISAGAKDYTMNYSDGLYIGRETRDIRFMSRKAGDPAEFYFVSYPAHKKYPTVHRRVSEAEATALGSEKEANVRTIYKYIHPGGIESCQIVMGFTELAEGSVWNTMPPHTHQRRSEVYMYFGLPPEALVFHMMGRPEETRHIVVRDREAVLSPPWSIHAGVATHSYRFVWSMGGENQAFGDMDAVSPGGVA